MRRERLSLLTEGVDGFMASAAVFFFLLTSWKGVRMAACMHLIGEAWAERIAAGGIANVSRRMWTHSQGFALGGSRGRSSCAHIPPAI
jgi:hypothetical protein